MHLDRLLILLIGLVVAALAATAGYGAEAAGVSSSDIPSRQWIGPTQPPGKLPLATIAVDAGSDAGPLELWRHSIGHGGVNSDPSDRGFGNHPVQDISGPQQSLLCGESKLHKQRCERVRIIRFSDCFSAR